jgi:hypothetical protein
MSTARWHLRRQDLSENSEFIDRCLCLWDEGKNTDEIASALMQPEYLVEIATRIGRERRRRNGGGNANDKKDC